MAQTCLLSVLTQRGFVKQTTPDLGKALDKKPTIYFGCDATAPSLHVGNLMGLMAMRWASDLGHPIVILVGGGTTRIGDPSGKDATRTMLSDDIIEKNIRGIRSSIEKIIDPRCASVTFVNNASWLDQLKYTDFLRDIGIHFSMNRMIKLDSVQSRLKRDSHLSFTEFNYAVLQAYDFLELHKNYNCSVQFGGSDQWGNIVSGVDLVRRVTGNAVHALTWPLLETASGVKMGKSASGAVWLNDDLLSPYQYWQFWRNVDDRDVVRFLKIFTVLPMDTIDSVAALQGKDVCDAKILLADNATALLHGKSVLPAIHSAVQACGMGAKDHGVSDDVACLPCYVLTEQDWCQGIAVKDVLVALNAVASSSQARRKIREGAVKINQETVHNELRVIDASTFGQNHHLMVSLGRKQKFVVHKSTPSQKGVQP